MDNAIAFDEIHATRADGSTLVVRLEIGTPYRVPNVDIDEWACPVSLSPLYSRLRDAHGVSSLQALSLALALGVDLLAKFVEDGGKLCYTDGTTTRCSHCRSGWLLALVHLTLDKWPRPKWR
jgi:hypothetical protein